jgi:hypothetical protein
MTKPTKPILSGSKRILSGSDRVLSGSKPEPCHCELVALDGKGREVPMNAPSMTGVAYRKPPKHKGRCRERNAFCPTNSLLGELEAEWRKLEGA